MIHLHVDHDGAVINHMFAPQLDNPNAAIIQYGANVAFSESIGAVRQGEPYPYQRTVHLLSPSVTSAQRARIDAIAEAAGGQSVVRSANDAVIRHEDITKLTVIVWNVAAYGGKAALEAWILQHYPPLPDVMEYRTI